MGHDLRGLHQLNGLVATRVRTAASTRQAIPWEARAKVPERGGRRSERPQGQLIPRTPAVHSFPSHLSFRHVPGDGGLPAVYHLFSGRADRVDGIQSFLKQSGVHGVDMDIANVGFQGELKAVGAQRFV